MKFWIGLWITLVAVGIIPVVIFALVYLIFTVLHIPYDKI